MIEFEADEATLQLGEGITLSWNVQHATEVFIDDEQVEPYGRWQLFPDRTTTYTLRALNEVAEIEACFTVTLPPPAIHYFTVAETEIHIGRPSILHWGVSNAQQVFIDKGVGEVSGRSFTEAVFDEPGPVTLRAVNASGEVSETLELSLPLPEILDFHASDPIITLGEASVLNWNVQNVREIFIDSGVGDVSGQSRVEVSPDRTTTYTLTARNYSGEVKQSVTLRLLPPKIHFFGADNELATEGRSVHLYWEVENAYQLSIDQGIGDVTQKKGVRVRPSSTLTTFILTATGHSGEARAAVDVSVFPIPMPIGGFAPVPEVSTDIALEKENFDLSLSDHEKDPDLQISLSSIEEDIRKAQADGKKVNLEYYKKMEISEELLNLEKPSLRKEIKRIYRKYFKKKEQS